MIEQSFKSKRVLPVYVPFTVNYSPNDYAQAHARDMSVVEYVRRDNMIKRLATECPFQAGDTAYPDQKKGYETYGAVIIVGICRTYKDFSNDSEWPKSDNPMIITFAPIKNRNEHVFCTTNYLVKKNPHLVMC
ncbi:hypothetical protein UFOVP39_40 [uncultured Caudovirales phage]|uniref:Uncharacterized protein n=1 Tax=uncultured Caudovirales phage TaxID=2100421 RepID=A0A6J5TB01_9CAUD|nr:hypothetical protein UFOVP39_40 [uncultured Caudovirales phage]